jgi:hypothetical protein
MARLTPPLLINDIVAMAMNEVVEIALSEMLAGLGDRVEQPDLCKDPPAIVIGDALEPAKRGFL